MSARELVVLGAAAQVPTRRRARHGSFLRWDDEGILFDPGEGTQRQPTLAGVAASSITRICLSRLHGDHCLGLPGVLQGLVLGGVDAPGGPVLLRRGPEYVDRLLHACISAGSPTCDCIRSAPMVSSTSRRHWLCSTPVLWTTAPRRTAGAWWSPTGGVCGRTSW
jgi:ribonuclease BN (tRNA processing enzyme)